MAQKFANYNNIFHSSFYQYVGSGKKKKFWIRDLELKIFLIRIRDPI
jgi:hypothetical protein